MNKFFFKILSLAMVLVCMAAISAHAHEFIVKPAESTVQANSETPISVVSAHVFMVSEEVEPIDHVKVDLIQGDNVTPVKLAVNEKAMTLDGSFEASRPGTAILAGHREGMIWTQTTTGWEQASKKGLENVIKSGKYEKFCKSLITVGQADQDFAKVIGQRLEIVPVTDPSQAKPGDVLEFKVLFDGKPFSTENMTATYDGFCEVPNTYAYFTEPVDEGLFKVKVDAPGLWMVRTQHVIDQPTEDYDSHVIRSVLVFEVK